MGSLGGVDVDHEGVLDRQVKSVHEFLKIVQTHRLDNDAPRFVGLGVDKLNQVAVLGTWTIGDGPADAAGHDLPHFANGTNDALTIEDSTKRDQSVLIPPM